MGVEACCTWGCSNKNKASVSFRSTYTLDFNISSFHMSDSENYETTFNNFLLHFLRYLCNFCPYTCSQEAKLMKGSHLGVVTLLWGGTCCLPGVCLLRWTLNLQSSAVHFPGDDSAASRFVLEFFANENPLPFAPEYQDTVIWKDVRCTNIRHAVTTHKCWLLLDLEYAEKSPGNQPF
jgi:hypothetical protein